MPVVTHSPAHKQLKFEKLDSYSNRRNKRHLGRDQKEAGFGICLVAVFGFGGERERRFFDIGRFEEFRR